MPSQREPKRNKKDKKPFHIKKKDLDLDEYRRELADREPQKLAAKAVKAIAKSRKFWMYVVLQIVAAAVGYGQFMLCIGEQGIFHGFRIQLKSVKESSGCAMPIPVNGEMEK